VFNIAAYYFSCSFDARSAVIINVYDLLFLVIIDDETIVMHKVGADPMQKE
jgi:hypothetical protein